MVRKVSKVGLVLGGGGITGAAFEMATLMAIELATGWDSDEAEVVAGTSSGAFVTSLLRNRAINLDSMVLPTDDRGDVSDRIRSHVYTKGSGINLGKWIRHGLVPGVRRPGLTMLLGSPAPYHAAGIADWVAVHIGPEAATGWPTKPTAIVAHDIQSGTRTALGTDGAPEAGMAEAVAASSALPLVFQPFRIGESLYVDGGVSSGTHADLVLGTPGALDLVLVVAPMAAGDLRKRSRFYERFSTGLDQNRCPRNWIWIGTAWPDCDVITLSPSLSVQAAARPNPMDPARSVPTFMRTLVSMKRTLAQPETWEVLSHHLVTGAPRKVPTP